MRECVAKLCLAHELHKVVVRKAVNIASVLENCVIHELVDVLEHVLWWYR